MATKGNSPLKRKTEGEFLEHTVNVSKLIKTLILSFLRSDSDYGLITDIKSDLDQIYDTIIDYLSKEKLDVYALKLDKRILLSKTGRDFENIYEVIKIKAQLQIKKDMIEIWDDTDNKILHLVVVPVRKHFPLDYSSNKQRSQLIEKISAMTWEIS